LLFYDYALNQMPEMDNRITTYNTQSVRTAEQHDALQRGIQQMAVVEKSALGFAAVGLVATSVGFTMFLLSDDPDQYE